MSKRSIKDVLPFKVQGVSPRNGTRVHHEAEGSVITSSSTSTGQGITVERRNCPLAMG